MTGSADNLEADKSGRRTQSRPRGIAGEKSDENERSGRSRQSRSRSRDKEDETERSGKVFRTRRKKEDESERSQKSIKARKTTRKSPNSPSLPQVNSDRNRVQVSPKTETQAETKEEEYVKVIKDAPSEKTTFEPIADASRPAVAHMHNHEG
ncbi:hypothetical protein L596_015481 [Steinernema carpocapsae]|uniref:Uncharacterized protein n=1 Tax=Steinernema carpocapsae TaxID=34508 RepID=A0A4U5NG03_STECR|nr:hypothetical protein L596_015481 [Steinernema carpocapsae]